MIPMIHAIGNGLAIGAARLKRAKLLRIKTVRRFAKGEDGIAAVEFALVAAPFLALLFAIMETSLVFFAGQSLETAVADSARLIMTGQAQSQKFDASAFKDAVCSRIYALFDCQSGLSVDVQAFSSFSAVTNTSPVKDGNFTPPNNY